jgi:mono/diheme cytochrome c family protein/nitrate/TMAO reductase-like tetraheme cytochrome c subunit
MNLLCGNLPGERLRRSGFAPLLVLLTVVAGANGARGQGAPGRDTIRIDASAFPPDVQKGYRLFRTKCAACHGLDTSLQPSMSSGQWTLDVKRMQAMASARFDDAQAKSILDFLNYDEVNRKALSKPAAQVDATGGGGAGGQFYAAQRCERCHAIGGRGGTSGPSLTDLGKRLSRVQVTAIVQGIRSGKSSMPPLPPQTTDQQITELVDFLLGSVSAGPSPDSRTAKEEPGAAKPVAQVASSGTNAAGQQFYEAQGCAKCHAIGGTGGTSGPSLGGVGKRLSIARLTAVFEEMRTGKSSMPPLPPQTTDQQVKDLIDYLVTSDGAAPRPDSGAPKAPATRTGSNTAAAAAPSGRPDAGRQFYETQGCAKCHVLNGTGGARGPSLSGVGTRLSRARLTAVFQQMRAGTSTMPPLPRGTTDQQLNDLVDFLAAPSAAGGKTDADTTKVLAARPDQSAPRVRPPVGPGGGNWMAEVTRHGATAVPGTWVLLIVIGGTLVLIAVLVIRPSVTETQGGYILAFFGLCLLPLLSLWMGTSYHITRSESTAFCMSCHEMEPFGKSLLVDQPPHLAAAHFQNHRVPAGKACYTCHTTYAMFGGVRAKMQGLKRVWVHYLGTPPAPADIQLSEPFANRECLYCHLGARSFEEGRAHNATPYLLGAVKGNQISCLSSGCHQTVHDVAAQDSATFWKGAP